MFSLPFLLPFNSTLMKRSWTCCYNPENQIQLVFQTTISIWQKAFRQYTQLLL